MGARTHAELLPVRRVVGLPAWGALVVSMAALVVGVYALRTASEDTSGGRTASGRAVTAATANPWAGIDREDPAALKEAGFTGRLGGATVEETVNPWAGVDVEALKEAGFTSRLGAATVREPTNPWAGMDRKDLEAQEEAGFTGRLGS